MSCCEHEKPLPPLRQLNLDFILNVLVVSRWPSAVAVVRVRADNVDEGRVHSRMA